MLPHKTKAPLNEYEANLYQDIVSWKNHLQAPISLSGSLPTQTLTIDLDNLTEECTGLITNLFKYYLQENPKIKLYFEESLFFKLLKIEVPSAIFNKTSLTPEAFEKNKLLNIFQHPTIFKGFITALTDFKLLIDTKAWSSAMQTLMQTHLSYPKLDKDFVTYFHENVNYLDKLSQCDESCLEIMYGPLIILLIRFRKLENLLPQLQNEPYKSLLSKLNQTYYFLHETLQANNSKYFLELLKLIKKEDIVSDQEGNNFWHLYPSIKPTTQKEIRKSILALNLDINSKNNEGDTPLHEATKNLKSTRFFLKLGAAVTTKNENNESPLDLIARKDIEKPSASSPKIYFFYKIEGGQTLSLPLKRDIQKGPCCAFYSLYPVLNFFRAKYPKEVPKIPKACTKDYEKKTQGLTSLRKLRKELNIPYHGSIFSVHHLIKIIHKLNCKSLICDITDYQSFITTINLALKNDLPLIVPFAVDGNRLPEQDPKADNAHWATINGYCEKEGKEYILVTQYGRDFNFSAKDLFYAFFNIEPVLSESYLLKKAKGEEWHWLGTAKPTLEEGNLLEVVPQTDLSDFRRKLVIGLPPSADPEAVRQRLNPPKNSSETVRLKI